MRPRIYDDEDSASTLSHSCIQGGWAGAGNDNIDTNPQIADADGADNVAGTLDDDLHLLDGSPCVNAGDDAALPAELTADCDGEDRIQQCRVDMGVDETPFFFGEDCNDNNLLDSCEIEQGIAEDCDGNGVPDPCDLAAGDADCNGNGIIDVCDIAAGTSEDCNGNDVPDACDIAAGTSPDANGNGNPDECDTVHNITQGTNHATIQHAIDAAVNGDEIEVEPGTYVERINLSGKALTLYSTYGPDVTIIDGDAAGHVVTCNNGEGADTVIDGFTVTNGQAGYGGGMYISGSTPIVANCVFSANVASGDRPRRRRRDVYHLLQPNGGRLYLHGELVHRLVWRRRGTA